MGSYAKYVDRVGGSLIRYEDDSESGKLRTRTNAVVNFAGEINEAWLEQEAGLVEHGLRRSDVVAILDHAAWMKYHQAVEQWGFELAAWERNHVPDDDKDPAPPKPIPPKYPKPAPRQIPQLHSFDWGAEVSAYLAWCRLRAGLDVAPSFDKYRNLDPYGTGQRR
jgi:hypothetical protein